MLKDPKSAPSTEITRTPSEGEGAASPESLRPWEDRTVSPEARFESYKAVVQEKLTRIADAFDRAGEAKDIATQKEIMNSPETNKWMEEGARLQAATAEGFCERFDRPRIVGELLGKNFLGAEAWKAQGIDVGEAPPLPDTITKSLLKSDCPLHPGKKIRDTHLLVLVPKTVNGEPYSALKLDELCATRKGSGDGLIYGVFHSWKSQEWACAPPPASEWVLIPKSDPIRDRVDDDKHFRNKRMSQQDDVHKKYPDYREVKTVEIMTAVLLNDLVNGEPRMLDGQHGFRCVEPNAFGGRVCVGYFFSNGLLVLDDLGDIASDVIGRALARKS